MQQDSDQGKEEEDNNDSDQGEEKDHNDGDSISSKNEEHKEDPFWKERYTNLTAPLLAVPLLPPRHLRKSQHEIIALPEPELRSEPELQPTTHLVVAELTIPATKEIFLL